MRIIPAFLSVLLLCAASPVALADSKAVPASAAMQAARPQVQRFVRLASLRDLASAAELIA